MSKQPMALAAVATFVVVALSGCLADGSGTSESTSPVPSIASSSPTATTASSSSAPTSPPSQENQPPTAGLTGSLDLGTAPLNVTFNVTGSDPDGDDLTWTLDADGDGTAEESGSELPAQVNATYATAGNYTANLTITDGDLSANATVRVTVLAPVATGTGWALADPSGDGTHDSLDIVAATMSDDGDKLTFAVTFKALQPQAATFSVMNFEIVLNDIVYDVTNCLGTGWDVFGEGAFLGADVTVDAAKNTIKVVLSLGSIKSTEMPYNVFFRSAVSSDLCGDLNNYFDRVPNAGVRVYP